MWDILFQLRPFLVSWPKIGRYLMSLGCPYYIEHLSSIQDLQISNFVSVVIRVGRRARSPHIHTRCFLQFTEQFFTDFTSTARRHFHCASSNTDTSAGKSEKWKPSWVLCAKCWTLTRHTLVLNWHGMAGEAWRARYCRYFFLRHKKGEDFFNTRPLELSNSTKV